MASVFDKGQSAFIEEDNSQALYAEIPGFVKTGFSSLGVFYPDKTHAQRKVVKIVELESY